MSVGKDIALEAKKSKICNPAYKKMLKTTDIEPLCKMYFEGDDWAMEHDFPNLKTLRQFKGNSDRFGIHTDFHGELSNQVDTALLGDSKAELNYDKTFAGKLIVRHQSEAKITLTGHAVLLINLLDNAKIEVDVQDNAKAFIYQYGNKSNYTITGNVEVRGRTFEK